MSDLEFTQIDFEKGGHMLISFFRSKRQKAQYYGSGSQAPPPFLKTTKTILEAIYVIVKKECENLWKWK